MYSFFVRITSYNVCYTKLLRNWHRLTGYRQKKSSKNNWFWSCMNRSRIQIYTGVLSTLFFNDTKAFSAPPKPNIVLVLMDDMGYVITSYSIHYTKLYDFDDFFWRYPVNRCQLNNIKSWLEVRNIYLFGWTSLFFCLNQHAGAVKKGNGAGFIT